jgi:acyl-CoA thioester hydrolase
MKAFKVIFAPQKLAKSSAYDNLSLRKRVCSLFFLKNVKFVLKMGHSQKMTVKSHDITIVPRYSETDQAGVVHHTVYPVWFEMGRTELLRANGYAYRDLEKTGVFFVVAELNVKYRQPAAYDEKLELTTTCTKITPARIEHSYILRRPEADEILVEAETTLACVDADGKIRRVPDFMLETKPA